MYQWRLVSYECPQPGLFFFFWGGGVIVLILKLKLKFGRFYLHMNDDKNLPHPSKELHLVISRSFWS